MAEMEWQTAPVWDWRRIEAAGGGAARFRAGSTPLAALVPAATAGPAGAAAKNRREGALGGAIGLAVAAILAFVLHRRVPATAVGSIALLVTLIAMAAPLTLYTRLRGALEGFGHVVGTVVTWVLMTLLFYLLFTPVGLVMRAMGKLTFTRFVDPALVSYWTVTDQRPHAADSYRKQF